MKPIDRTDPVEGNPDPACQAAPDLRKVLILGGYGVFGGRLARLLLQDGIEVIVAGRDAGKAAAFTKQYGGNPLFIGIGKDLSPIAEAAPALVVDAGGRPSLSRRSLPRGPVLHRAQNQLPRFLRQPDFTASISALNGAAIEAAVSCCPAFRPFRR